MEVEDERVGGEGGVGRAELVWNCADLHDQVSRCTGSSVPYPQEIKSPTISKQKARKEFRSLGQKTWLSEAVEA